MPTTTGNKLNKQLMFVSIKYMAEQIVAEKKKNNGRVPWGFASKLLKEGRETFPKMSLRTVNNYVKKLEKEQLDKRLGTTLVLSNSTTIISSITNDGASESTDHASADSSDASSESEQSTFTSSNSSTEDDSIKNLGGRPKGTTAAASHEIQKKLIRQLTHLCK